MGLLARYAIERSRLTIIVILALVVGGLATYFTQPSQEDPEIVIRTAVVTALFPGMSAERIEQLIVKPIEERAKELPEVTDITSTASTGQALVKVEVADRYFDLDPIWQDLRTKMSDLAPYLPKGTIGPLVNDDYGRVAVTTVALTGSEFSLAELRLTARDIRNRITALSLVSRVELFGVQQETIWLEVDPARIAQYGLSVSQVVDTLRRQNVVLPGGTLRAAGMQLALEPSGDLESIEQILELALTPPERTGAVYLRDIATVRRAYSDPAQQPVFFNGQRAIVIAVSMISNANIAEFGKDLQRALARLGPIVPVGMKLDIVTDQAPLVAASIEGALANLLQAVATVLLVVVLFLGVRMGATVGLMVPLAIFAALVGMALWEIPLHRISIAAIIIALGLLVDNAIVVAEDIRRQLDEGVAKLDACLGAASALALPLLTSTLTTVLAFLPMMLAENVSGEFVRALSQVITLTLLASWLIAVAIMPALSYWMMPDKTAPAASAPPDLGMLLRGYRAVLQLILRIRIVFLGAMMMLLALGFYGLEQVTPRLMPPSERPQFVINLELPAGSDSAATIDATRQLAEWLADPQTNPEVTGNVAYVGAGGPRFFLALAPLDPAPHAAFIVVNTAAPADVRPLMDRVDAYVAGALPGVRVRAEQLFLGATPPGTVDIRVSGDDLWTLQEFGRAVEAVFRSAPGARHFRNDWGNPVLKLRVAIRQEQARRAGITSEDVARALSAYLDGAEVSDFRERDIVIPVLLRAGQESRVSLDDLRSMTVVSPETGEAVPIMQVAEFQGVVEPYLIRRFNQQRAITVSAVDPALQAAELYAQIRPALAALEVPKGFTVGVEGELKDSGEANRALFKYMPHCLAAIVALLIWQFNSFRRPLIIVLTIPLIVIGAALGLLVAGAYFDFVAMLGLVSLAGIIINNAIVMIDRIDGERKSGKPLKQVVVDACLLRARPILMTTLTTVCGLLPLLLLGGEFWYAMSAVIIGGLLVGTVLTLGVVPVLYSLAFDFRARGS